MNTTDKELTYTVTEKEYQEGLAKGWTDDDMLKPGTYKVRRARHIVKPRDAKVNISLCIDGDILEYFFAKAESSDPQEYQARINDELRRIMENDSRDVQSIENDILNNEEFLRALKEKLAKV